MFLNETIIERHDWTGNDVPRVTFWTKAGYTNITLILAEDMDRRTKKIIPFILSLPLTRVVQKFLSLSQKEP